VLFILMPAENYQVAASVNQAAMFSSSVLSSLIGFALARSRASVNPVVMFYVSLVSECMSLVVLAAAMLVGWIPSTVQPTLSPPAGGNVMDATSVLALPGADPSVGICKVTGTSAAKESSSLQTVLPLAPPPPLWIAIRAYGRTEGIWCWVAVSAVTRAIHTHVLTLWTSVVRNEALWDDSYNGLVATLM